MKGMFIRHKFGAEQSVVEEFRSQSLIGVHFENIPSTNPSDPAYDRAGQTALKRLWGFCDSGALVGATYPGHEDSILVGEVESRSKVEPRRLSDGRWYKVVQLKKAREVFYRDYPILLVQPPLTTIARWLIGEKTLEAIVQGKNIPWEPSSLHYSLIEVVCYEFLRTKGKLSCLVMPIGRNLQHIDIWGLNDVGRNVLAQVTFSTSSSEISDKLDRLKFVAGKDYDLYFFAPKSKMVQYPGITFVSVEDAFDEMTSDVRSTQYRAVARMLGRQDSDRPLQNP